MGPRTPSSSARPRPHHDFTTRRRPPAARRAPLQNSAYHLRLRAPGEFRTAQPGSRGPSDGRSGLAIGQVLSFASALASALGASGTTGAQLPTCPGSPARSALALDTTNAASAPIPRASAVTGTSCALDRHAHKRRGCIMEPWLLFLIGVVATTLPAIGISLLLAYADHKRDLDQHV